MDFYNLLTTRVHDVLSATSKPPEHQLQQARTVKAAAMKKHAKAFMKDFRSLNDAKGFTHYIKCLNREVIWMSESVDLIDVSGQCIEALNQLRKKVNTSRGGGGIKGGYGCNRAGELQFIARQLGQDEVLRLYICEQRDTGTCILLPAPPREAQRASSQAQATQQLKHRVLLEYADGRRALRGWGWGRLSCGVFCVSVLRIVCFFLLYIYIHMNKKDTAIACPVGCLP